MEKDMENVPTDQAAPELPISWRKKTVVIEAMQYGPYSAPSVALHLFLDGSGSRLTDEGIVIPTLEGDHLARVGDWIIKGVQGEFYPCKPDIFAATYEPADLAAPSAPAEVEGLVAPHSEQIQVWADELMSDLAMRDLLTVNDYDDKISALREIREKLTLCAAHRDDALTALQAENERLQGERQALAEAICGGEDFPGLLAATSVDALVDTARKEHRCHRETFDARLKAEDEVKGYREWGDDVKRLTRDLDVEMHGEENAAKQASLCDLIGDGKKLRERAEKAERELAREKLAHTGTITQRDYAEEWADKLAYAIGGDAIGEHSSINNPWAKAHAKLKGDV